MGRMIRVVVLVMVSSGCSGGGGDDERIGGQPDGAVGGLADAAGTDAVAADGAVPAVPFEDRAWGPLQDLGAGRFPEVAIDAAGNAMTTWDDAADNGCVARRKPLDGGWEADVALVTPQAVKDEIAVPGTTVAVERDYCTDGGAGLAMDASGSAIALFIHFRSLLDDMTGKRTNMHTGLRALYDPASGWSEGELSGPNGTVLPALYTAVAMNADGSGLMAWARGGEVWAARYEPGTGWDEAVQLDLDAEPSCCVRVVLDGAGNGLAVWKRVFGDLRAARLAGGTWSNAAPVDEGLSPQSLHWDVDMNEAGAALLVWRPCDDLSLCPMRARRFDPSGGWSPSEVIGDAGQGYDGRMVDVALDPDGNGLAVWVTGPWDGRLDVVPRIDAARFRDGAWLPAETIAEGVLGDRSRNPVVVLDGEGNGLVAGAIERRTPGQYRIEYLARTYIPGVGFGSIELLDKIRLTNGSRLELAMNPAGIAMAAWGDLFEAKTRLFR